MSHFPCNWLTNFKLPHHHTAELSTSFSERPHCPCSQNFYFGLTFGSCHTPSPCTTCLSQKKIFPANSWKLYLMPSSLQVNANKNPAWMILWFGSDAVSTYACTYVFAIHRFDNLDVITALEAKAFAVFLTFYFLLRVPPHAYYPAGIAHRWVWPRKYKIWWKPHRCVFWIIIHPN